MSGATAVLPLTLLPFALRGGELVFRKTLALGLDFILVVDPLSVFMAVVSSFIGSLIVLYSLGYISHDENQNEYYLMVVLFLGAMMGLVFSGNLIFLYLFWEITAIACWRLIGFFRGAGPRPQGRQGLPGDLLRRPGHAAGLHPDLRQTGTFDLTAMRGDARPRDGRRC